RGMVGSSSGGLGMSGDRHLPQHLTWHPPRGHGRMDLHDANWERFCRYHVGGWYGLWAPYTMGGGGLAAPAGYRRFHAPAGGPRAPSPIRITTAMQMAGRRPKPLVPTRPPPRAACLSRRVFPGGRPPSPARPRSPSRPGSVPPSAASASWSAATPTGGGSPSW